MDFIEEYNNIISLNANVEDKFSYYLIKANLEYRLDELLLCRESFLETLKYMKFNDKFILSLLQLACICSELDALITALKKNEQSFLEYEFSNPFVLSFEKAYKVVRITMIWMVRNYLTPLIIVLKEA
ncbi:MAG TPA: hypothetical protein VIK72_07450 [Clostridiaceae bacterium]